MQTLANRLTSLTHYSFFSVALSIIVLTLSACTSDERIQAFSTDGCSSFPEGTHNHKDLWLRCCTRHDIAYWQGGSYQQRLQADLELKQCVSDVGKPLIAELMLAGVRVGGSPYWPTKYRWGYGWPYPRGYQSLLPEEQMQAQQQLELYQQDAGPP